MTGTTPDGRNAHARADASLAIWRLTSTVHLFNSRMAQPDHRDSSSDSSVPVCALLRRIYGSCAVSLSLRN
jgi:hypothetical protein